MTIEEHLSPILMTVMTALQHPSDVGLSVVAIVASVIVGIEEIIITGLGAVKGVAVIDTINLMIDAMIGTGVAAGVGI